jgi:hypothetical protein
MLRGLSNFGRDLPVVSDAPWYDNIICVRIIQGSPEYRLLSTSYQIAGYASSISSANLMGAAVNVRG